MAKGGRARHRIASRRIRSRPHLLAPSGRGVSKNLFTEKCPKTHEKRDWEDVICSVCMECPHNAVLLLCSSHDKGCRPYMCGTSFRYSNCLDQYKKASTKLISSDQEQPTNKCELTNLTCPLCRGQVKGWTVVEPAREYLNLKKRSCMQENCSFAGTYKELRKHMRAEHPSARPREVDPFIEQKWRRLERQRDRDDVISTIRSTMPGAMVFGDYVIERNHYDFDSDDDDDHGAGNRNEGLDAGLGSNLVNVFLLLHAFGPSGNDHIRRITQSDGTYDLASDVGNPTLDHPSVGGLNSSDQEDGNYSNYEDEEGDRGISLASRLRRHGTVLLNRSGRRRRHREGTRGHR